MDFIESEFLDEQITSINQLRRLVTMASSMNGGIGEYLLDRQLLAGQVSKDEL